MYTAILATIKWWQTYRSFCSHSAAWAQAVYDIGCDNGSWIGAWLLCAYELACWLAYSEPNIIHTACWPAILYSFMALYEPRWREVKYLIRNSCNALHQCNHSNEADTCTCKKPGGGGEVKMHPNNLFIYVHVDSTWCIYSTVNVYSSNV